MYKRLRLLSFMLIMLTLNSFAYAKLLQNFPRGEVCLNGEWEIYRGESSEINKLNFDEWNWDKVRIPGKYRGKKRWYKLNFMIPKIWQGKKVVLRFDRVNAYGKIFVNKKYCGEGMCWPPFEVDITKAAMFGRMNELLVFVQDMSKFQIGKQYTYPVHRSGYIGPGILGNVYLKFYPKVYVKDVFVITSYRKKSITAKIWISNEDNKTRRLNITDIVKLLGKPKLTLPNKVIDIKAGESKKIEITKKWENPILWGFGEYGSPTLYFLQTSLLEGNKTIDRKYTRFGFREFWAEGKNFIFNGKKIFLLGDCTGWPTLVHLYNQNRQVIARFLKAERGANIVFLRHSVINGSPIWYKVADELGMLMEGLYLPKAGGGSYTDPTYLKNYKEMMRRDIINNRNHPSLVIWSMDNENATQYTTDKPNEWKKMKELAILTKKYDPTRLICYEGDPRLGLAKDYGIDMDLEIFNLHTPGGGDMIAGLKSILKEFKYNGKIPVMLGEWLSPYRQASSFASKSSFWKESFDKYPGPTYRLFKKVAKQWHDSIIEVYKMGIADINPFTMMSVGYMGLVNEHKFVGGPWNLHKPINIKWPSVSGEGPKPTKMGARGEPLLINWFDPTKPEYTPNLIYQAVKEAYKDVIGKDAPLLNPNRVPEVIVKAIKNSKPLANTYVYLIPEENQSANVKGVMTDKEGTAWFILNEPGKYKAICETKDGYVGETDIVAYYGKTYTGPGYDNIQRVEISKWGKEE